MRKYAPILILLGIAFILWASWRTVKRQPVVPLIGWSPYNTSPMPSRPAPSSNVMGMSVQAR